MKQIRRGVFETNSSSVHSLTICPEEQFDLWKTGMVNFDKWEEKFVSPMRMDDLSEWERPKTYV